MPCHPSTRVRVAASQPTGPVGTCTRVSLARHVKGKEGTFTFRHIRNQGTLQGIRGQNIEFGYSSRQSYVFEMSYLGYLVLPSDSYVNQTPECCIAQQNAE